MKKFTTATDILVELNRHKPVSTATLYRYFSRFNIRPMGEIAQRPQLYPANTATKILKRLGLQ